MIAYVIALEVRHAGGVVENLETIGLESELPARDPAYIMISVRFERLFEDLPASGVLPAPLEYVSAPFDSDNKLACQERVCLDIFTFLLLIAPAKVKISEGSMTDVATVRNVALQASAGLLPCPPGSWRLAYFGDTREPVVVEPARRRLQVPTFQPLQEGGGNFSSHTPCVFIGGLNF